MSTARRLTPNIDDGVCEAGCQSNHVVLRPAKAYTQKTSAKPRWRWNWLPVLAVLFAIGGCDSTNSPAAKHVETAETMSAERVERAEGSLQFRQRHDRGFDRYVDDALIDLELSQMMVGGVTAADYDDDGDIDLYVVGRDSAPNHLYENRGDATFREVGARLGVDKLHWGSGAAFGDYDGDGDLDLMVGAVQHSPIYLLENQVNEEARSFVDVTYKAGLRLSAMNTVSPSFFDYDRDGRLDLFLLHWGERWTDPKHNESVWRNAGDGTFINTTFETTVGKHLRVEDTDWSFTPNFGDIDGDGDADLLLTSDFDQSQVLRNNDDGTYTNITDEEVIVDQSGMGASLADFDRDGDLDWFVTSIYNLEVNGGEAFGNRMYRNLGDGIFEDATLESNTQDGNWGWASCAADFDNDGHVDIFHVNGWIRGLLKDYSGSTARLFRNTGSGMQFEEIAQKAGFENQGQGRGLVCFDADRDGDLDIFYTKNANTDNLVFYENITDNHNNYLTVRLQGRQPNTHGVGSHITLRHAAGNSQIRLLGGTNNYLGHDPLEAHFGLGTDLQPVDLIVRWPDGAEQLELGIQPNQVVTIEQKVSLQRLLVRNGSGSGGYSEGDVIEIVARPPGENYHFVLWTSQGGGEIVDPSSSTTRFVVPAGNVTVTAHYLVGVGPDEDVSVARRWNELLLESIRNDFARPTVHARNLFHGASASWDIWTLLSTRATPWLLDSEQASVACPLNRATLPQIDQGFVEEALSFAAVRLIRHRFASSPGFSRTQANIEALLRFLNYERDVISTDYANGTPAALGNYIAECYIALGHADGSNELEDFANVSYEPVNPPLMPHLPGNPLIVDLNRWQPLSLLEFIDQAGNPSSSAPEFLSPEWGRVWPFSLQETDRQINQRMNFDYWVYHDPGPPPQDGDDNDLYSWAHTLVSHWSAHLDPADEVLVDISPAGLGNNRQYPPSWDEYPAYYASILNWDENEQGYEFNPVTNEPYKEQIVPRGDYARVLAEFWADGPDSETPPGHWFVLLNEVHDHADFQRRFMGLGSELDALEWDVKAYFAMGGAMHDAAITAWGIKGWYDYVRPISSIRALAERGQSSDAEQPNFHADGIPLATGLVELVEANDPLVGDEDQHLHKIKIKAWRGPEFIDDPAVDVAGVGWIRAENWWPYQRPSFVTPPFAGYVSGHSTYSRAGAEVLTALTGSAFFPGGMSGFVIPANEFLVFERGPSVDLVLQWATYQDAADQSALSRIWGGIHPPVDDIPGRIIGAKVGRDAFERARTHFNH